MVEFPPQTANPPRPTRPWCLFQCGGASYAIGLEAVAEVVEVDRLVRLPHSPPQVLGLCTLRREVIPVIGLDPAHAGIEGSGPGAKVVVLVLKTGRGPWAIRVNSDGTSVTEGTLDDPHPAATLTSVSYLALAGTVRRGETVYAVIDPETTWRFVRERVEDWYRNQWARTPTPRHAGASDGRAVALEARP